MEEDVLLNCNADKSQSVYVKHNIDGSNFDMTSIGDKVLMGRTPVCETADWYSISKLNLDGLVMYPLEVGATSTTGWADSYYNPALTSGLRGAACLGYASYGGYAGSAYLSGSNAPSGASAHRAACLNGSKKQLGSEPSLSGKHIEYGGETRRMMPSVITVGTIYRPVPNRPH